MASANPSPYDDLAEEWLSRLSPGTRRGYRGDLNRFGKWIKVKKLDGVSARLLKGGSRRCQRLALKYRAHLDDRGLAPATINRALAALRSLVAFAYDSGDINWLLRVSGPASRAYRDTRGPDRDSVLAIIAAADDHPQIHHTARDGALIRLLYGHGLRRSEVTELDCGHIDPTRGRIMLLGKGHRDRAPIEIAAWVMDPVCEWLAVHPSPGPRHPLFVAFGGRTLGERLSGQGVADVLATLCARAGVDRCTPHAFRHAAITHVLDATAGDIRGARAFSRHAKLETLSTYDDNRRQGGKAAAELLDPADCLDNDHLSRSPSQGHEISPEKKRGRQ